MSAQLNLNQLNAVLRSSLAASGERRQQVVDQVPVRLDVAILARRERRAPPPQRDDGILVGVVVAILARRERRAPRAAFAPEMTP